MARKRAAAKKNENVPTPSEKDKTPTPTPKTPTPPPSPENDKDENPPPPPPPPTAVLPLPPDPEEEDFNDGDDYARSDNQRTFDRKQVVFALQRCGFNRATAYFFVQQGFDSVNEFDDLPITQITDMLKAWQKMPTHPKVRFPQKAINRLLGLKFFMIYRGVRREVADLDHYETALMSMCTEYALTMKDRLKTDGRDIDAPHKIKSANEFEKWRPLLVNYLTDHLCPYTAVPLSYLLRPEEEDTQDALREARHKTYPSLALSLHATIQMRGLSYATNNTRFWCLLMPLVIDGTLWSFAKPFQAKQDGRGAFLAIQRHCRGASSKETRKAAAYPVSYTHLTLPTIA